MQETKPNNDKLTTSAPPQKQSETVAWLIEQLTILAEALGESMTTARLKIYAVALIDLGPRLEVVFQRAIRECKWWPKIAELRELAGAGRDGLDAEARAAWDELTAFVRKYVGNDVYGNFGPEHGWYPKYPKLSDRLIDVVRRTGGWAAYACMSDEDFPFVQKRFFEEYKTWSAVENVFADRGYLPAREAPRPALTGETANRGELVAFTDIAKQVADVARGKSMPEHIRRQRDYELRTRHVPAIPAVKMSAQEIEARRDRDRAEIKAYRDREHGA